MFTFTNHINLPFASLTGSNPSISPSCALFFVSFNVNYLIYLILLTSVFLCNFSSFSSISLHILLPYNRTTFQHYQKFAE